MFYPSSKKKLNNMPTPNWELDFEYKFRHLHELLHYEAKEQSYHDIKDFITNLLASEHTRWQEDVKNKIAGMEPPILCTHDGQPDFNAMGCWRSGKDAVLKIIEEV